MTPEERIALNISLYQRFLGHEGHDIRYEYLSDPWLSCMTCAAILRDLTTDGNAMLALKAAVAQQGWVVESAQFPPDEANPAWAMVSRHDIDSPRVEWSAYSGREPEAVALAAAQIPEATP